MSRYLRLYLHFLRFSYSKAMTFRLEFFFRIFMDLSYYVLNLIFFKTLFLHTDSFGGWDSNQMIVFIGFFLTVDAINMTVFANNMWWMPIFINRGDLDYYLIRPVSSLFFLSLREFAANSFINLFMSFGILVWGLITINWQFSTANCLLLLILILCGSLLYYFLHLLTIIPTFWTQSARGFVDMFWPMTRLMERPDRIYQGLARVIFTYLLPFTLMASYPSRLILESFDWMILLHISGITIIFFILVLRLWKFGLRFYSSASS